MRTILRLAIFVFLSSLSIFNCGGDVKMDADELVVKITIKTSGVVLLDGKAVKPNELVAALKMLSGKMVLCGTTGKIQVPNHLLLQTR